MAESLNNQLAVFNTPKHKGVLGHEYSFVKVNTPQVAIRSLKKSDYDNFYIIRLYEMQGRGVENVEIAFPVDVEEAYETNGLEEKIGDVIVHDNKLCFNMTSYSPKTFAVRLKKEILNSLK